MGIRRARNKDPLIRDLLGVLPPERVRVASLEQSLMQRDASIFEAGRAGPVCFPLNTGEVQGCVNVARHHGRAVVPRGAGTGLAGGAVPLDEPVMVVTTKMNRLLSVDPERQMAWVQPGMINLDLSRATASHGLHFAPDPSSQQVCSLGGNVATNSGGPHCLAHGVTSAHVLAVEVVLMSGEAVILGDPDGCSPGLDLRGAFIGSEGMLGIATAIAVRLMPNPPAIQTLLLAFDTVDAAARTVSAVIAGGIVPAAIEMMDANIIAAVEEYVGAGFPTDAAAVVIVEVDGLPGGVEAEADRVAQLATERGGRVRRAADDKERALLWKGRKSAFGAIARIKPNYYLHDTVVPRTRLAEVMSRVYEIVEEHDLQVMNVFHAGDGNLHPLLLYDRKEPGIMDRVHAAGSAIIEASLAAGGVLSGEHGIGIEKRDFMPLMFSEADLDAQRRLRRAFDPGEMANPGKVLPTGSSCADINALDNVPEGVWG
ncbi:FAD-linked oxidase C-terminal domain-containing protein [Candidatus Poriferisocius sp.]|uniref:FAD-linked oxidase C-terminal domain-containing protein n=1 Tax=Candidatus Poriferisocius sp. TaxID=3101276 RepID=UPI003B014966